MDLMWEFLLLLFFGCSTTTTSLLHLAAEATAGSWSKGVVFKAVNWATGFASSRVWSLPTEKALDDLGAETRRAHRAAAWKVSFVIVFMLPDDLWCDECDGLWTMDYDYAKISMIFWRLDLHSSLLAHQFSSLLNIEYWILNNLCTYLASRSHIDPAMLRHEILYGVGKVKKWKVPWKSREKQSSSNGVSATRSNS